MSNSTGSMNAPQRKVNWLVIFIFIVCALNAAAQGYLYSKGSIQPYSILQIIAGSASLFLGFAQAFPAPFKNRIFPTEILKLKWKKWDMMGAYICLFLALISTGVDFFSSAALPTKPPVVKTITPTSTIPTPPTPPNISDGQRLYKQIILGGPPNWADNLDNPANQNGWSITSGEPTGCLIQAEGQDNKNYYYAYSHTPGYVDTCFSRQRYTNFGYQAHMTVREGDGGGLIFRSATNNYNSAMDRFDIRPQQQVFDILVETDNAKRTNSACDSNGDAYCYNQVINKTGENTLAVIATGNILYFYINGTCVAGVKDVTNGSGLIGVFAVDAQHPTNVAFDSAEAWNLP